jgi:hypothetical protein
VGFKKRLNSYRDLFEQEFVLVNILQSGTTYHECKAAGQNTEGSIFHKT